MKKILGISAFYHDAAAALVIGGKVVAAAQEERFTRKKHTADFPEQAIRYCLDYAGIDADELDAVVFYDKPLLKFERLLQTYYAFAPRGWRSFLRAMPVWIQDKLFLRQRIREGLKNAGAKNPKAIKLLFSEHHLSHAASAFFPSPFTEAAILTIDGVGEWATASMAFGKDNQLHILQEMYFPHSVGLLYSAFTYWLGFTVNSGEYKLMGLAPYGYPQGERTKQFISAIYREMIKLQDDGSLWLNQDFFDYAAGDRMANHRQWEKLFGFSRRNPDDPILPEHTDLAQAIQQVTEEIVLRMAREAKRLTGADNLCLAGGVALNCVANGRLQREGIFKEIFIQPASGDAGGAPGAAWMASSLYFGEPRYISQEMDGMQGSYLGPEFSDADIEKANRRMKAVAEYVADEEILLERTAHYLSVGSVVGWFQGRMEFGPRALGNRSILGDARQEGMQKKLNRKVKFREGFRPFAPAVAVDRAKDYFDLSVDSPYMLLVSPVLSSRCVYAEQANGEKSMMERLYNQRSDIQAVTHVDYSARVQTVHADTNPRFYHLLQAFEKCCGSAVLVNTSFNVRGEPPVCTPQDAYRCFMATDMDVLVMGNYIYIKSAQPDAEHPTRWRVEFLPD